MGIAPREDIRVYLSPVCFIQYLVPCAGVQFEENVFHTGIFQRAVNGFNASAVISHRICVAGKQRDGQTLVHLLRPLGTVHRTQNRH